MSREIGVGDIVVLKSGGPPMVVAEIEQSEGGAPVAKCDWFDSKKPERGEFPLTSLKKG